MSGGGESGRLTGTRPALAFLLLYVLLFFGGVLFGCDCLVTTNMSRWLPWRSTAPVESLSQPSFRDDSAMTYFPRRHFSSEEMKAGRIPLWNHTILCGTPHLADFQSCVFHPLNLVLLYWTDPLWSMGAFVAVHLFLGGLFLFFLLRRLGAGAAGSLIGALSFLMNAYFATYLGHPVHISTGCWIPLLLLLAHRGMNGKSVLFLPVAAALTILGGFPQTVLYGFLAAAAFALFQWSGLGAGGRKRGGRRLVWLGALFLIGIGITLFQILPTAELGGLSERQVIPVDRILDHHMPTPWSLIRTVLPGFFGNPVNENSWIAAFQGPLPHPSDLGFLGYGGIIPLLLALAAPFVSNRRERWFFAGLGLAVLLLLFVPPLYALYYKLVPFARMSTEVHRLQFPFLLSTAVLAGLGYEGIRRRAEAGTSRSVRRYLAVWLIAIPVGAAALQWGGPALLRHGSNRVLEMEMKLGREALDGSLPPGAVRFLSGRTDEWMRLERKEYIRFALLLGAGAGALLALGRSRRRSDLAALALLLVVAVDGWTFARGYYTPQPAGLTFRSHRSLERLKPEEAPFRIVRTGREYLLPPNSGSVYGIEDLQGVNALMPADYGRLIAAVDPTLWPDYRRIASFDSAPVRALPLWDLLNVRYYIGNYREPGTAGGAASFGREKVRDVTGASPMRIMESGTALPRAFLRHRWVIEKDRGKILEEITSPLFDPFGPVFLEKDPGITGSGRAVLPDDICTVVARKGSELTLRTVSSEPALLFLSETWYPGWEATIDGEPAPVLRADYAFRALPLPAGEHQVVFRYRPASFRRGLAGSALFFSVYLLILLGSFLSRRVQVQKPGLTG